MICSHRPCRAERSEPLVARSRADHGKVGHVDDGQNRGDRQGPGRIQTNPVAQERVAGRPRQHGQPEQGGNHQPSQRAEPRSILKQQLLIAFRKSRRFAAAASEPGPIRAAADRRRPNRDRQLPSSSPGSWYADNSQIPHDQPLTRPTTSFRRSTAAAVRPARSWQSRRRSAHSTGRHKSASPPGGKCRKPWENREARVRPRDTPARGTGSGVMHEQVFLPHPVLAHDGHGGFHPAQHNALAAVPAETDRLAMLQADPILVAQGAVAEARPTRCR